MHVLERARLGNCSFGVNISLTDPEILVIAKEAGFHFARIDCEHILFDDRTLAEMIRLGQFLQIDVQIRVPALEKVPALLDMGANAIMVPHIENRSDAEAAAAAVKYPPLGDRGLSGAARAIRYSRRDTVSYQKEANGEVALIAQVESVEGFRHLDEILAVPGLDMIATGRNDLSQSLGIPGQKNHPRVIQLENQIIKKTLSAGKIPTILCKSADRARELYANGVRCFSISRDELLLKKALGAKIHDIQNAVEEVTAQ